MTIRAAISTNSFAHSVAALLFVIVSILYGLWCWTELLGGWGGDNAWYLLTAKFLSPYSEVISSGAEYFARTSPYPPLMPLILALSGGAESLVVAHLVTMTFLLLSFVIFYLWSNQLHFNPWQSLALVLAVATTHYVYYQALEIHSENFFLFFTLLPILLVALEERQGKSNPGPLILAAALIAGLAILVRSIGITMLLAFAFVAVSRFQLRQGLKIIALLLLPYVLASLFNFKIAGNSSYFDMLSGQLEVIGGLGNYPAFLLTHFLDFIFGWHQLFRTGRVFIQVLYIGIGVVCLAGMCLRLRERKLDGYYCLAYLGMLMAWPFSQEPSRYLMPILPVLLIQGLYLLNTLRLPHMRYFQAAFILFLLFNNVYPLLWTMDRYMEPIPDEYADYRNNLIWYEDVEKGNQIGVLVRASVTELMQNVAAEVPVDDCILSTKPPIVSFYSQRISLETPAENLGDQDFLDALRATGCGYILTIPYTSISYATVNYPLERMEELATPVMAAGVNGVPIAYLLKVNAGP